MKESAPAENQAGGVRNGEAVDRDAPAAIDSANAEAWRLRARDPEHAVRAATEALERAEAIGYDRGIADALTTLAYDDMRRAHYPDGQEKGRRALEIYRAEGNRVGEAWVLFVLGVLTRFEYDTANGFDLYEHSVAVAHEIGRDDIAAFAYNGIGNLQRHLGQYDQAVEAFIACRDAGRRTGEPDAEVLGVYGLGTVHLEKGELAEAAEAYRAAEAIARASGFTRFLRNVTQALTIVLSHTGDYTGSLELRAKGLEQIVADQEWREAAEMMVAIADDYIRLGDYAMALESLQGGLRLARTYGLRDIEADAVIRLGRHYEALGYGDSVIDQYLRGLRLAMESGDHVEISIGLFYIGRWYGTHGDEPKALAYYLRCLRMCEGSGYARGVRAAQQSIGNIYHTVGDDETARAYFTASLETALRIGEKHDEILSTHALGAFEKEVGNVEAARALLDNALAMARAIGERELELAILNDVIAFAAQTGDRGKERRYHQERQDLSRLIFTSESARRVRSLISTLDSSHAWYEGRELGLDDEDLDRVEEMARLWQSIALVRMEEKTEGKAIAATKDLGMLTPQAIDHDARIRVDTLGAFTITIDGETIATTAWKRKRARDLFKLLLLNHRSVVTVAEIEERLWGEPMGKIESLVMNAASHIRSALGLGMERGAGRPTLTRAGEGYLLDLGDDVRIDFIRFQDLIIAARRAENAEEKAQRYAEALAIYRGGFLPEDTFAEWTDHQRRLLNDAWFEAAEYLAREALREGRVEQAIDHARRILQQDTTSESAWHVLLQGLIDRRRLADLRDELERCRRAFDDTFGEEPPKRLEMMVAEAVAGKG